MKPDFGLLYSLAKFFSLSKQRSPFRPFRNLRQAVSSTALHNKKRVAEQRRVFLQAYLKNS